MISRPVAISFWVIFLLSVVSYAVTTCAHDLWMTP
jgi:hypothetical protein